MGIEVEDRVKSLEMLTIGLLLWCVFNTLGWAYLFFLLAGRAGAGTIR